MLYVPIGRPSRSPNRHQPKVPHSVTLSRSEGSVWITHIVTQRVSGHRTPPPSVFRFLVAAPCINARVRCAGLAQVTMWVIHTGLSCWVTRCFAAAQHDRADFLPRHRFLIERSIQCNRISFWELALQTPNPNSKWYNFLYEPQIHARLHWEEQWIQ
jgi:hypothetical protein